MAASKQVAHLWNLYIARETAPGYSQPFWNCGTAITREEIDQAIQSKSFNPKGDTTPGYQGHRAWHIRQIAGIVNFLQTGGKLEPIQLHPDGTPGDGCHRLYAHWYLNREWIEVTPI
jgi:hypothetical protein